tara:strand:+ start:7560 stop:8726 length:1167 start_codon:yes stop_codon:yes gene_type:complete
MNILPKKLIVLGSGELGKELIIEAKRLGCYVISCDKYDNAPAMQIADEKEIFDMKDKNKLYSVIKKHKPNLIIPEVEAISVEALLLLEKEGFCVIPNAKATQTTMNRDLIRDLAYRDLNIATAKYAYASSKKELIDKSKNFDFPIVIKPIMSSSGKGQTVIKEENEVKYAWDSAMKNSRGNIKKVIIEQYINFEQEITLLTIRQKNGITLFCPPIGHTQIDGDYRSSWQPCDLKKEVLDECKSIAKKITDKIGGVGLYGVELFITKRNVIFSELSPRPHDTGLVTLLSQNMSEFELHIRAILELPIPEIKIISPSASSVILSQGILNKIIYKGIDRALKIPDTKILIFGKRNALKPRRMGVALASGNSIDEAIEKALQASNIIEISED